jgi:hypothetical protein
VLALALTIEFRPKSVTPHCTQSQYPINFKKNEKLGARRDSMNHVCSSSLHPAGYTKELKDKEGRGMIRRRKKRRGGRKRDGTNLLLLQRFQCIHLIL